MPAVVNPNTIGGGPGVWLSPGQTADCPRRGLLPRGAGEATKTRLGNRYDVSDEARAFIASVTWVFAKTRAEFNPHEYVVERTEGGQPFTAFVALIRSTPIRRWRGGRYHCLTVDEHDYWLTHGAAAGWIVNRKPTDRAGWDREPAPSRDPSEIVWHDFEHALIDEERRDIQLRELENRD